MANIKLIYIDKDKWEEEVGLFAIKEEIDNKMTHEFVCYNNVVSLEHDSTNTTMCTLSNLGINIDKKITSAHEAIVIVGFGISLEYLFLNLLDVSRDKELDIYVLDKSKFPIRSNVTMTIDLEQYDVTTDFNAIKDILEKNLNDSLENARKSRKPEHANDLGISLKEEKNSSLYTLFSSLGLEEFIDELEVYEDNIIEKYGSAEEEINNLLRLIMEEEIDSDLNVGVKINNNIFEISDKNNTIKLNKASVRKLIKMLEVLTNE